MRLIFGECVIDSARRELLRAGEAIHIEPQVFDLLLYLIDNRERVVSKDDLLAAVWRGRIVSESTLGSRINAARAAIGDNGQRQGLIRTVARKGLRFVGEVSNEPTLVVNGPAEPNLPLALLPLAANEGRPAIAVLPFVNISGDPEQEYFADGLSEDIITDLSRVSSLFVVARHTVFSFKGRAVQVQDVARELGVCYVLEGSVRKAEGRVRITAQLVDGHSGGHIWAERYESGREDIFRLQDEISQNIVAALKVKLLPEELATIVKRPTSNAEAYRYYLMGRAYFLQSGWGRRALDVARQKFAKAVAIDPGYARAYAGLANCDSYLLAMGDPVVPFEEIIANCERALILEPELADAHAAKGLALYTAGRHGEADTVLSEAVRLGPRSFEAHFFMARNCRAQGRFAQAAAMFEHAADLQPDDFRSLGLAVNAYRSLGQREKMLSVARRCLERVEAEIAVHPDNAGALALGAVALTELGDRRRAEAWADEAQEIGPADAITSYNLACAQAGLGRHGLALARLQQIFGDPPTRRRSHVEWLKHDSAFAPMRGQPGFEALLRRLDADAIAFPAMASVHAAADGVALNGGVQKGAPLGGIARSAR
ncbi:MAG TPA: winged helix-turn-helix domain-containing protein [Dongiaceae bacterium]